MTDFLKTLFYKLYFLDVLYKIRIKIGSNKFEKLIICDIDNTILKRFHDGKSSYSTDFLVYKKVIEFVKNESQKSNCKLLFLSARGLFTYYVTFKTLCKLFPEIPISLILTRKAFDKIHYLKYFSNNIDVLYIDDLTYLNDNADVCFYGDVIAKVQQIKRIKYIGYEELVKIQ
jgi:hypothetical protein